MITKPSKKHFFDEKRRSVYLLSFLLPLILMIAILVAKHVFPFGDKCILKIDFYHQYLPFYTLLQDKLKHLKSLFYAYEVGLGTNFITLMAYYLMCPLNLLLIIVGKSFVIEFMTVMIVLKIALAGFTFSYYAVNKYKNDSFVIIFFALFYAMGGYMAAYYWDIMWLDNIVLFPILVLTFEKMFNGGKMYPYIITLAVSLLCNYYIGIITCIFIFLYFIFYSILTETKLKKSLYNLLRVGASSIIGILISCIILLPVILAFKSTASSDIEAPVHATEYFSIIECIARMLPFVKVENGIEYWPNIYSGTFTLGLFTMYLLSKKVKLREKICYSIFVLFFIASFSINYLDFVWHIFKFPNSLPCRQSFIFIFFMLIISIKPLLKPNSIKEKEILIGFAIPIVFIILIGHNVINTKVGFYSVYAAIISLFIYMGLMLLYKKKSFDKNILLYITIVLVSFEAFINMYETSISTIKRDDYTGNVSNIMAITDGLKNTTDDFYRIDREKMKTKNDGAYIGFPSASIFSSSAYAEGTEFYKKFGLEASTNAYSMTGSTPFTDSLLSVKYRIYEKEETNAKDMAMRKIADDGEVFLYQNLNTLPFSYVLENDTIEDYDISSGNPAIVQNNFSRTLGFPLVLSKVDIDIDGTNATYNFEKSGNYFAFIRDKGIKTVAVTYPTTTKTFENLNRGYFIDVGFMKEGERIEFRNDTNDSELLMELFYFNYDALKQINEAINNNFEYDMLSYDETNINYNIKSHVDGTCIVTLPYDEGFTIYVDDKKVEKKHTFDFFLSFDITKGDHNIKITYMPAGFVIGSVISLVGLIVLILIALYESGKIKLVSKEQ